MGLRELAAGDGGAEGNLPGEQRRAHDLGELAGPAVAGAAQDLQALARRAQAGAAADGGDGEGGLT
jgi:hypothetical protein